MDYFINRNILLLKLFKFRGRLTPIIKGEKKHKYRAVIYNYY